MEEVKMNWLSDQNGNLLAPKTLIEAVQNAEGTSLEELLKSSITFADTPIGTIISYMGNTAPKDYLICDGTEYEIVKYKDLAEHIKKEFGSYNYFGGDGVATFAVPDLRGEFLRGTGENAHENGGSGANVGEHQTPTSFVPLATQDANLGNYIQHEFIENYDDNIPVTSTAWRYVGRSQNNYDDITAMNTWGSKTSRPTNTSVLYCIKYKTDKKSANIIPQHEYSTEEKVVGKWIDGKPIYEKVFEIGSKSSAYTFTIENLDKIIDYTGNCIISDYSRIIPFVQPQYDNYVIINDYKDGVVNLATNLTYTDCVLVIQYTKITD